MSRYSHQYLIAVTVENEEKDPAKVTLAEMVVALERRTADIYRYDGLEAFSHNDTEEI